MTESDQRLDKPQPPLETPCDGARIKLPEPSLPQAEAITLDAAITNRRSIRKYKDEPISLEALSYTLWATQGVQRKIEGRATLRTVPSAGARHPFDTYLLVNNISGLEPGLYRYIAMEHTLVKRDVHANTADKFKEACLGQDMVKSAAVTLFYVADTYRMSYRYSERGYRYIFLDAGHVMQNLYLVAEQLSCGTCAIGAFDDDAVNALLGLDGKQYFTAYIGPLGIK